MLSARFTSFLTALLVLLFVGAGAGHAATGQKRVALVIGNSEYAHTSVLNNPVRDATAMADALKRLGFDVVKGFDLDQSGMYAKIKEFTSRIDGADVTLFYYAGHGFQIDGKNYLAPVDATLKRESDVDFETVPLNLVLRQMERERRTNIVFLDACRDNPLASQLARTLQGRSVSVSRGLARVESGIGMLIGYSTSPGMVAYDGKGEHSPYTNALLKHIEKPGLSINDMMIAVRQDVLDESKGKQIPWEHSSLTGQYYFKKPVKVAVAKTEETKPSPAVQKAVSDNTAVAGAYAATVAVGTCRAYKIFEEQHRNTFYGRLAEEYIRSNCSDKERTIQVEETQAKAPAAEKAPVKLPAKASETPAAAAVTKTAGTPAATDAPTGAVAPAAVETPAKAETPAKPVVVAAKQPDTAPGAAPQAAEQPDPGAMTVSIQKELARVGCNPGPADGDWGRLTTAAIDRFNEEASLALPTDGPSEEALAALKAKTGRVCAAVVIAPAAPSKPRVTKPKVVRTAPVKRKSAPPKKKKKPKEDEYWGGEDTRVQCERGAWTLDCFKKK